MVTTTASTSTNTSTTTVLKTDTEMMCVLGSHIQAYLQQSDRLTCNAMVMVLRQMKLVLKIMSHVSCQQNFYTPGGFVVNGGNGLPPITPTW